MQHTTFEKKKKAHRQDLLASAIGVSFLLILGIFFGWMNSSDEHGKFIEPNRVLIWALSIIAIIILLISGLTTQDFILKNNGIQLPRSKISSFFYRPKLRKYSDILNIKIIGNQKKRSPRFFSAEIQFKDGYVGIVSYWELRNLGISTIQTMKFYQFLIDLNKKISTNRKSINESFEL